MHAPLLPSIEMQPRAIPPQDVIDSTHGRIVRDVRNLDRDQIRIMRNILTHYRLTDNDDIVVRSDND